MPTRLSWLENTGRICGTCKANFNCWWLSIIHLCSFLVPPSFLCCLVRWKASHWKTQQVIKVKLGLFIFDTTLTCAPQSGHSTTWCGGKKWRNLRCLANLVKSVLWNNSLGFKAESSYRVASRVSPHTGHIVVSRYLARGSSVRLLIWVLFMWSLNSRPSGYFLSHWSHFTRFLAACTSLMWCLSFLKALPQCGHVSFMLRWTARWCAEQLLLCRNPFIQQVKFRLTKSRHTIFLPGHIGGSGKEMTLVWPLAARRKRPLQGPSLISCGCFLWSLLAQWALINNLVKAFKALCSNFLCYVLFQRSKYFPDIQFQGGGSTLLSWSTFRNRSANWIQFVKFCGVQAQKSVDIYEIHCAIGIEVIFKVCISHVNWGTV